MFLSLRSVLSREYIKKCAAEVGFTLCGVARARVLAEHAGRYAGALAVSGSAALDYLVRDPARRLDPARLVEGARTVVVCAVNYRNARSGGYPADFAAPRIASYALSDEYQPKIRGMLAEMAARLRLPADGGSGRGRTWFAASDTSAILEKAWAVEAGLGWVGRHSLLVTPRHGSFLLLGELIVADGCDSYDEPYRGSGCGTCGRCVEACPAGALLPQGVGNYSAFWQPDGVEGRTSEDAGRPSDTDDAARGAKRVDCGVCALHTGHCISALTIERVSPPTVSPSVPLSVSATAVSADASALADSAEPEDTARLHGWLFGCDECQTVCPYNKLSPVFTNPLFAPTLDPSDFSTEKWLAMGPDEFAERFSKTPLARAGWGRMKKNVARAKKGRDLF